MYRPAYYAIDDAATLHRAIAEFPFATIARSMNGSVDFAYAPVVLDRETGPLGGARFHLARANPLSRTVGGQFFFSFRGPDSYVSPDWYSSASMVPTWNYVAIEAHGSASVLDETGLRDLLVDLSAQEETKLSPKVPWTLEKLPRDRQAALMHAIVGFAVRFDSLRGKFKLSQDKCDADFAGVVAGLEARASRSSLSMAAAMKQSGRKVRV